MSFIEEVDDIFNTKLDKGHYSNFREVYGHLLYDSIGRIKLILRDIDKTLLYADIQSRLSFDSDLCDISLFKKLVLIQSNITTQPICQCANIIKYTNARNGLYTNGCSNSCRARVGLVKGKQTNLERYGVENSFQSKEVKDKIKQTNLERYSVENVRQCKEIQDKVKQTNLERYGVEYSFQSREIRDKAKRTNIEHLGVENPQQCKEIQEKTRITFFVTQMDSIWETISSNTHCRPLFGKDDYIGSGYNTIYNWQCTNCNQQYESYYYAGYVKACPTCKRSRSLGEIELYNYIQSLIPDVEVLFSDYSVIPPKEIDIYIPSLKLAFEYNGDYWHGLKGDGYHEGKTRGCLDKGVVLYHIWESDWKGNTGNVKDLIKSVLCRL